MIIRTCAYPRIGLIGNPSDGYFGKTISLAFTNFCAEVTLYESPELEILPCQKDRSLFDSIYSLMRDVKLHGYYGGIRLLKATVKRFFDYCSEHQIQLHQKNFTIRYESNIPHSVGLAGSSAIITACMRALMVFYGVAIPRPVQAGLILSAEKDELGISAGLQDRVIQVYEGLVYMDFDKKLMEKQGHGHYEPLNEKLLPKLFMAYRDDFSEPTEVFHNDIRGRFNRGEKKVVDAMKFWANLTDRFRAALEQGDVKSMSEMINANFDRRCKIYKISDENLLMVETARSVGASAKFTGSGGAIVGICKDEPMFGRLKKALAKHKIKVIKPRIATPGSSERALV
jgi:glucuronokinase